MEMGIWVIIIVSPFTNFIGRSFYCEFVDVICPQMSITFARVPAGRLGIKVSYGKENKMNTGLLIIVVAAIVLYGLTRTTESILDVRQAERDNGEDVKIYL